MLEAIETVNRASRCAAIGVAAATLPFTGLAVYASILTADGVSHGC
jgi:hypothetical protein